ncbi:hypothetical protein F4680DRAFT_257371 [Xylaria scruposa]|nr:hypothetical protein F4680DRAFT_257371 [Xylaria scruposa]
MADPLATLSLASSVLQVIDFASGFATTAWKFYQAAGRGRDGPDEVVELREINNNLATILREIRSQPSVSEVAATNGDDGITNLAKECAALVEELLQTLPSAIEVTRKRDAIRAAFKLKWKSDNIRALQARLSEFRSQLTLNLLVSMRQYARQSLAQQESILGQLSGINHKHSTERIGISILDYVTSKLNPASQPEEKRLLQNNIVQAMRGDSANNAVGRPWSLDLSIPRKVWADSMSNLLTSLNYAGIDDRELRVAKAHSATFRWLFDENEGAKWTGFKGWLGSEEKLYWITGKAGSGKSTLMKYISHHEKSLPDSKLRARCHQYLSQWSGSSKLIIASFYFWNSGTHMQTTQKGLMMTLLQQILRQCPDLIPLASPTRWEMLCLFGGHAQDWDEIELRCAIHDAITNAQDVGARIALFIDGLDEFEDKSVELIEFLQDIIDLGNIKVCVSSRPWTSFEDAFCHKPSLRLEDLTYDDVKKFVDSRFDAEPLFRGLRHREGKYAEVLIESIVSRAQGVFLWVALVVSSLIAGLNSGDRVSDLEKRLALLPPDLEGLYEKILLSLDPFYLDHAAQLFALVAATREPINIVIASFADEEEVPKFCLRRDVQEMSEAEIQLCLDTMRRRVNTRTKGLLEIKRPSQAGNSQPIDHEECTIQYFHRTVKDYVEGEAA